MSDQLNLSLLAKELQALETETFEIVDYSEVGDLLSAAGKAPVAAATSTSSCTSTCSSTTSCTSTCA
ncbi:thiazolylpeptide-type bacteriocin [Streptacidiphilus sp. PAMC 29251]